MALIDYQNHRPNLSEVAYQEIKEMILSGKLSQGKRIILDSMAELLNLSVTPVREALNKLAQEDLVRMTPRTSYAVAKYSIKDVSDIYDLRELIETYALKSSGGNLSQFPVARFRELFNKPSSVRNYDDFVKIDIDFHKEIISLSQNLRLFKMFDSIYNAIRILSIPSSQVKGRMANSCSEHLKILNAIEMNDVDYAVSALSFHIKHTKHIFLQSF